MQVITFEGLGQTGLLTRVDEAVSRFCLGRKQGLSDLGVEQELIDEGFTIVEINAALAQLDSVCPPATPPAQSTSALVPVLVGAGVLIATLGVIALVMRRG